jgi:hypothetical protein
VVDTQNIELDMKSIRSYGIHGAIGLFMGIGAGIIPSVIIPVLPLIGPVIWGVTILAIYGFYMGYIFGGQKKSGRLSISGAVAGVVGGLIAAVLLAGNIIKSSLFDPLFIILVFSGIFLGLPKPKNMVLLGASSVFGVAAGYGVYTAGQNLTVYLNNEWMQGGLLILLIAILFHLLAIGIAGASIAIGIYFTDGTVYMKREVPLFLKITRGVGIVLTLIVLFISTLMFLSIAGYATTEVSIDVSSGDGNITLYVPVLLDKSGKVMELYKKLSISGTAITEIIETDRGPALKISGSGAIGINMNQTGGVLATDPQANDEFINGFKLSTSSATHYGEVLGHVEAWVYSENEGARLSFSIRRDNGWGRDMRIRTESPVKLTKGWQAVKLSVGSMWYD